MRDSYGRWDVPESLRRKMVEVARGFRKEPTRGEAILWNAVRRKALNGIHFRRQQNIGPFVVDFYAPAARLIIEVDGAVHETQQERDQASQQLLESLDLRFLRVRTEDVEQNLPFVLQQITTALNSPFSPRGRKGPGDRGGAKSGGGNRLAQSYQV